MAVVWVVCYVGVPRHDEVWSFEALWVVVEDEAIERFPESCVLGDEGVVRSFIYRWRIVGTWWVDCAMVVDCEDENENEGSGAD